MTLVLETGAGVRLANSYVLPAFVTTYLTDRGRQTENTWSTLDAALQEAACIAATDYIDTRWGQRFKGTRLMTFADLHAIARIDFAANPAANDTVTLGSQVYTFVSALNEFNDGEVLIAADPNDTVQNLIDAVNGATTNTSFSATLDGNDAAGAERADVSAAAIKFTAIVGGTSGNDITLAESSTNITLTSGFVNGKDGGSQPLEFPRSSLFNQDGIRVTGIPRRLKEAAAEYAVRAAATATELWQDPVVDSTGRAVVEKMEKVGPIEESTRYEEGAAISQLIKPYPAADRLLQEYITPSGRVSR